MDPQQPFDMITNNSHIDKRHHKDRGIDHPFFDTNNRSNIRGYQDNSKYSNSDNGEYDNRIVDNVYSKSDIVSQVSKFNKYYSDVNFASEHNPHNRQWGEEGLEKRVGYKKEKGDKLENHMVNGRVDGVGVNYIPSFHSNQDNEQSIYNNFASESVKGNFDQTELSRFYFSEQNVTNLQMRIRERVYKLSQSKYKIDNQSENALKTVMRSYFLQYKISTTKKIIIQINEINTEVIKWCADEIYSNLLQYQKYKKDISSLATNIARPFNVSIKGANASFDLSSRNDMRY
jgi:hypothetical protein